jgi:DNA-binding MarR family transcriptional regulator
MSAKTVYENYSELTDAQTSVMRFFGKWVENNKTPLPHKDILLEMEKRNIKSSTAVYSINVLIRKGYIRRVYTTSNKSFYVMLRKVV